MSPNSPHSHLCLLCSQFTSVHPPPPHTPTSLFGQPLSLISILTASFSLLSSYLPAAAQGLLAHTVFPQTKEWMEVQKKKCNSYSLSLSLSLSFVPEGVFMVSDVSVLSNGRSRSTLHNLNYNALPTRRRLLYILNGPFLHKCKSHFH